MKLEKIVIAGGNGFIGNYLCRYFESMGVNVVLLSRKPIPGASQVVLWDGEVLGSWAQCLEGADILINLAGKSVNCRYHEKNKKALYHSRLHTTALLGAALRQCQRPPALWINASSATVYRHATDRPMEEYTGELGSDFSPELVKAWEQTFFQSEVPGVRQIALRMAITLEANGGVFPYYLGLVKALLGGKQGMGTQKFSWIHAEDIARAILWMYMHPPMNGIYNLSAPNPSDNQTFMRLLRNEHGTPWGIPLSAWMLELGAWLMNTETELLLKSRWVLPQRLTDSGFEFKYPHLEACVKACFRSESGSFGNGLTKESANNPASLVRSARILQ
ncbi:MAG: TIGR01777 family oxidoreductase [Cytophagaceae bacterium]|jgi:hypothetical protein|nr:TIGR01777 family oxidoreductase [Cytophagaceae bacterium]